MRLHYGLFTVEPPDSSDKDFLEELNGDSLKTVTAFVEPSLVDVPAGTRFQFERHGYFVTDLKDHAAEKAVFNRVTGMKDNWGK